MKSSGRVTTLLALTAVLLLGRALPVLAEELLTWDECIAEAAAYNASLQAADRRLRAAQMNVDSAHGGYFPEVNAEFNYDYGDRGSTGNTNSYSAGIKGKQNLFGGFADEKRIEQARAAVLLAKSERQIVRAQVSFELKTGFQELLFAQSNKALTGQIIARREENYRLVSLRYDSGRENKGSVLLFQAYLEQARYEDLQAGHDVEVARAQLRRVMGRDERAEFTASGVVPMSDPLSAPDFGELARQTPEYQQALYQEQFDLRAISLARSPLYPSLDLNGQFVREGDDATPDDNNWSVGASLNVPLFSGLRDYYSVKSARALAEASSVDALDAVRRARTRLEQTHAAFVESRQKVLVDELFMKAASIRAEIARSKYNNGLLSFEDWDVIENDLISRQKNHLQSLRNHVTTEAAWQQAQGKAVFE
ncbi:MAG: TolC family protein [Chrysiogenetes bacterium]|nr:TolC family protein [Chrysiogenetes bacterium]